MRKIWGGLFLVAALLASNAASAFDRPTWERLSERRTQDPAPQRFAIKGYVFSIYPANAEHPAIFVAERRGTIVHLAAADRFNVLAFREDDWGEGPDLLIGARAAADGAGAKLHAFVLAPGFFLQTIGLGDVHAETQEPGEDSAPRVQFADYAFMGWNAAAHNSPAPNLQLVWSGGKYAVDPASLRRARPNDSYDARYQAQTRAALDAWKAQGGRYVALAARAPGTTQTPPPSLLWRYMLNMIYTGDSPAAKRLFEAAWPDDLPGKAAFWRDFLARLRQSQAWRDLDLETALDAAWLFDDPAASVN
ncbi:MAG: hypothetical protein NBV67_12645 [Tagaea sp.]|nr:hypothetical protein [Tagaea sp.]